jgi:hypothetical protein
MDGGRLLRLGFEERQMTTKNEQLQNVWRRFEHENGSLPASAREAAVWGVSKGLLSLPDLDPYDALADDMARALREEYATDKQGRRYRVNHAVRVTRGGVQHTFWAILGDAPVEHMKQAFAQRREQIVGDCLQLRTDVDAYNSINVEADIQLELDFTMDVEERLAYLEAA